MLTFGVLSQGISGPGEKITLGYDGAQCNSALAGSCLVKVGLCYDYNQIIPRLEVKFVTCLNSF